MSLAGTSVIWAARKYLAHMECAVILRSTLHANAKLQSWAALKMAHAPDGKLVFARWHIGFFCSTIAYHGLAPCM